MPLFTTLTHERICQQIDGASKHIVLAAPGITLHTAQALVRATERLGCDAVQVVLDVSARVARLGYGQHAAVQSLEAAGVLLRHHDGLRIGVLICDDTGWTFATAPTLVEADPTADTDAFNAIALTETQVMILRSELPPATNANGVTLVDRGDESQRSGVTDKAVLEEAPTYSVVGTAVVQAADVQKVTRALEIAPPQAFDLARQTQVYAALIHFVELSFEGFNVQSRRVQLPKSLVSGDELRDWSHVAGDAALFPYDDNFRPLDLPTLAAEHGYMWPYRTSLSNNKMFGKQTKVDAGLKWWEYGRLTAHKLKTPLTITFAEIATHNHFVLDRGGKVFKQTAPVIKLPAGSSEDEHLALLGLLNSSVACFWLKQVSHQKQMMGGDGIRISEKSKVPYQFASTRLQEFPMPENWASHPFKSRLIELAREVDRLAQVNSSLRAEDVIERCVESGANLARAWEDAQSIRKAARAKSILIQEEIDFLCYAMYGLADDPALLADLSDWDVLVDAGCRPFCILSQRNVDGFDVPESIPDDWPESMRSVWAKRMQAIKDLPALVTIEDPHYKRRWIGRQGLFNHGARANEFANGLRDWMLKRLEAAELWPASPEQPPQLNSASRLADAVSHDADFMQIAALYAGHADFDLPQLIAELVATEAMPALPAQRYTDTGLRKRAQWQDTWALQRREDAIDAQVVRENADIWRTNFAEMARTTFGVDTSEEASAWIEKTLAAEIKRHQDERKATEVGAIPVPPKYQSKDFLKADFWRLRGGPDVPKERWISYPGCERGSDGSLVIAWAGWDHLQQATALAGYYVDMKDSEGWEPARLQPLLASLLELVPWLEQWHNELDPIFGERMGDYYRGFVTQEARDIGFTLDDLRAYKPTVVAARRGRRKAS